MISGWFKYITFIVHFISIFPPLFFFTLQYCIGFAIYQHESATGVHVFPILNLPPRTIPLGHPSPPAPSILYPASKLVQPLWRTVWRFLKKLEIELPYDPAIPLLGIHTKETIIERDTCTPKFIAALFIIARTWKQPRCPSADEWIRKLWYIYTMEYYSAISIIITSTAPQINRH